MLKMCAKARTRILLAAFLLAAGPLAGASSADITRSVLAAGGGSGSAAGYVLQATLGEGFVGVASSATLGIASGYWLVLATDSTLTAVLQPPLGPPPIFRFDGAAPNPMNPVTRVSFELPEARHVKLDVFDVRGARVRTLVKEVLPAGMHRVPWDGKDAAGRPAANGIYFVRIVAGRNSDTQKVTVVK